MLMEIIGYEWDINGIWKDRLMGYTFLSGLSTAGLPNMMRNFFLPGSYQVFYDFYGELSDTIPTINMMFSFRINLWFFRKWWF